MRRWILACLSLMPVSCAAGGVDESGPVKTDSGGGGDTGTTGDTTAGEVLPDGGCATGTVKCGDLCVDTKTDAKNCGGCAKPCASGLSCVAAACACDATKTKCGTGCVDVTTDSKNCGACAKACLTGDTCEGGICLTPCPSGQLRCAGKCVDVTSDAANCGACAKPCPTGQSCVAATCTLTCDAPLTKCTDKCVNTGFDADNCGGCGKKCVSGPKSTPACTSGGCLLVCDAGYANCNDKPDDGCEVDLKADSKNCGACAKTCSTTETCTGGACVCATGGTKCPDGTCSDLTADALHCGTCTTVCGTNMVCSASTCVCKTGYTLCGGTCYLGSCPATGFPGSAIISTTDSTVINGWTATPSYVWTRCYSKLLDGAASTTFHTKCDGKGPSVVVAKLSTGRTIGAYASKSWASTGSWMGDANTFLFSLANPAYPAGLPFKHTYKTTVSATYTQYSNSSYGPTFGGGHDWTVNSVMNGGYCYMGYTFTCRLGSSTGTDTICRNDFCGTYDTWTVLDLEVWVK